MGRKIPAKKHRGVKDPLVQQAKRLVSLKGKINAPPKDPDEQPVPKSLTRLFAFRDPDFRSSKIKKKKQTSRQQFQGNDKSAGGPAPNPVSSLRKLPGESGRGFSLRINSAVKALHNPAEELHYPLDMEAEDEKGLRMNDLRERRARKRRRAAQGGPVAPGGQGARGAPGEQGGLEPALTRIQKFTLKKKARMMKTSEASGERREVVYERVVFGDVAHAPPALHFKHAPGAARPGRRDLLLSGLLGGGAGQGGGAPELRRQEAVAAYRALKASKLKHK